METFALALCGIWLVMLAADAPYGLGWLALSLVAMFKLL